MHEPLAKAIEIAARAHSAQRDKGGGPYILHPIRVMLAQQDPLAQIAAVLHDVVEDSAVTFDDLADAGMPDPVLEALRRLTHPRGMPYTQYIDQVAAHPIARAVKLADLDDNLHAGRLRQMTDRDIARMNKYLAARDRLRKAELQNVMPDPLKDAR